MAAVTISIGTAARDYATFNLAKADDWGGDGLSNDDIKVEPYNDSEFDESVFFEGAVASLTVLPVESERHDGTAGNGVQFVRTADLAISGILDSSMPAGADLRISWLSLTRTTTSFGAGIGDFSTGGLAQVLGPAVVQVDHCIVHDMETSASNNIYQGIGIQTSNFAEGRLFTNIVYNIQNTKADSSGSGSALRQGGQAANSVTYNNVVHNCGKTGASATGNYLGVEHTNDADQTAKNNIATDSVNNGSGTVGDFDADANVTYGNNHSSDLTASGTGSTTGIDPADIYVSVEPGMEDFHLKSGASVIGLGADLGTTPDGIEIDIDGEDRTGLTWDPGADQFVESEGPLAAIVAFTHQMWRRARGIR